MKRMISILLTLLAVSSVGFASPLNDFSQGKVAIDVSVIPNSDLKASEGIHAWPKTFDGKDYREYGIAIGLGNNLALQYCKGNPKSQYTDNLNGHLVTHSGEVETQEFNVMHKINNNYSIFTGIKQVKEKTYGSGREFDGDTKTNWQLGVTGQTQLGKNLIGYATLAAGKDVTNWKLGMSYELNRNLDFNIFYEGNKYNKVTHNSIISK